MLTRSVRLTVYGDPIPKGSMKCVGQGGRHQLVEANPRTRVWRRKVALEASKLEERADHWQPVGVDVIFELDRPGSHYGTGRNAHELRGRAPAHPTHHGTGDIDKLLRLILDALQDGHLLHDDAQVVSVTANKCWAGPDGPAVVVVVYPVEGDLAYLLPPLRPHARDIIDVPLPELPDPITTAGPVS